MIAFNNSDDDASDNDGFVMVPKTEHSSTISSPNALHANWTQNEVRVSWCKPFGWNRNLMYLEELSPHFPTSLILKELPLSDLDLALTRILTYFRKNSIQVDFQDAPIAAKLQTVDRVELYFKLWTAVGGGEAFYVDIQRNRGDPFRYNQIENEILEAMTAAAISQSETPRDRTVASIPIVWDPSTWQCSDNWDKEIKSTIYSIHQGLTSPQFGARKSALEDLLHLTDMEKATPAITTAMASILLGGVPSKMNSDLAVECDEIRHVLFRVLAKRNFAGDERLCQILWNVSQDIEPFMINATVATSVYPPQYIDAMSELYNMALWILIQSLQVLRYPPHFETKSNDVIQTLLSNYTNRTGTELYETLVGCVGRAETQQAEACLACKALQLLVSGCPALMNRLQTDSRASQYVIRARETGRKYHAMLEVSCDEVICLVTTVIPQNIPRQR